MAVHLAEEGHEGGVDLVREVACLQAPSLLFEGQSGAFLRLLAGILHRGRRVRGGPDPEEREQRVVRK